MHHHRHDDFLERRKSSKLELLSGHYEISMLMISCSAVSMRNFDTPYILQTSSSGIFLKPDENVGIWQCLYVIIHRYDYMSEQQNETLVTSISDNAILDHIIIYRTLAFFLNHLKDLPSCLSTFWSTYLETVMRARSYHPKSSKLDCSIS